MIQSIDKMELGSLPKPRKRASKPVYQHIGYTNKEMLVAGIACFVCGSIITLTLILVTN